MVTNPDNKSFESRQTKTIPKVADRLALLSFLIHVQAFRDPIRGELPHVQIIMHDGLNSLS
jgi:hypothetical protein